MKESQFNRFTRKYDIDGDGKFYRYEMLANAAYMAPEGIVAEIGFRSGAGLLAMIQGKEYSENNLFIAIDPFGNIPYREGARTRTLDYTNERRRATLRNFYTYLHDLENTINFIFFNLESIEFFNRFSDGVPDYFSGRKVIRSDYAIAHLDGQHDTSTVLTEVKFFIPRIKIDGFIVIDNTEKNWMNMDVIETELFSNGFVKHDLSAYDKWAYIKKEEVS